MSLLQMQIRGQENLRQVARALRLADKEGMRRELGTAIRKAARPTLEAIKTSARDIHTTGMRRPGARHPFVGPTVPKGTRAKIADAVVAEVRIDEENPRVRFRVSSGRLPLTLKNMPRKFDGGQWRHPVMGNRDVWVGQTSQPWFWPPIRDHIRDFRAEIDQALDRVREQIERS